MAAAPERFRRAEGKGEGRPWLLRQSQPVWIVELRAATAAAVHPKTGGGRKFNSDWTPLARTFRVDGAVTIQVFHDSDRLHGWWCDSGGPGATYMFFVSSNTLTLAPARGHDACGIRGFIWTGQWTRVG
jgi:hypothetical protein